MIAALDATPLTLTSGGLARYVSELSLALARQFPEDTYALLSDQAFELPLGSPGNLIAGPEAPLSKPDRRWWLRGARKAMSAVRAQVFHGTNFEVPYLGSVPSILTIHDLSPWRDASWHGSAADRVRSRTPWLLRLRRARMILTVSEAVRREIITHFGVTEEMVRAIPLAASSAFYPVPETIAPSAPYFLFVGTLEPRKNLPALMNAWRETHNETGAELWIAGRRRGDFKRIEELPGMKLLGEVSDAELPALYSSALAFVYPSLYEGFGLPVLEAMQCGCPVITSNDPAIAEVSGDAVMHAASTQEIAQSMRVLAADPARRKDLRKRGFARAKQYSWDLTARRTRALYQEVAGG
ncbi:MAG TPA: glycosyltransferase family 1 protein [Bryobacteraceae bacterium]